MNDFSNLTNERAVIGSLLIDPDAVLPILRERMKSEYFSDQFCKLIFDTAIRLADKGVNVDAMLIANELEKAEAEVNRRMAEIMTLTPTAANVELYVEAVKQDAFRSRLNSIASQMQDAVITKNDWTHIMETALAQIEELSQEHDSKVMTSLEATNVFCDYYELVHTSPSSAYTTTGYGKLDEVFGGGMFKSGLYIIGARPGMGKTTLGINIAENIAKRGDAVLFISLEMSAKQIMAKRLALESGWGYTIIMTGRLSEGNMDKYGQYCAALASRPFYISEASNLSVSDVSSMAHQIPNLKCIVVDYLGLLKPDNASLQRPRYEEVSYISGELKTLAKRLELPIIVLAQLNRQNTQRKEMKPQLQDLRDSGAIEQDADAVVLLHRPNYYTGASDTTENITLFVAKDRHGRTGDVEMLWKGRNGQISEVTNIPIIPIDESEVTPF